MIWKDGLTAGNIIAKPMTFWLREAESSGLIKLSLNFFTLILSIVLVGKQAPYHHYSEAW